MGERARNPGGAPFFAVGGGEAVGIAWTVPETILEGRSERDARSEAGVHGDVGSRPYSPPHGLRFVSDISNISVLICDDAIFMRRMISDILMRAGYRIAGEASNGLRAVELYRTLKPDLVTMDIVMPEMGGIDAVREIMRIDPEARILMCSAMGQQALVVDAIEAGARDFIVKPFQPGRVLEAARRVLA